MSHMNRRKFIGSTIALGITAPVAASVSNKSGQLAERELKDAAKSIRLDLDGLSSPIIIQRMDLLKVGETYLVRTRSSDGHVGVFVTNKQVSFLYAIFLQRIAPFFIGKDARDRGTGVRVKCQSLDSGTLL